MKKQLLLGFLPALLVLSACNGGGQVKEKYDDLLEDTLAHEEIFDQQEQGLTPRRLLGPNVGGLRFEDPTPETEKEEVGTPYIGVQSIVSGNTVSFRFVAAVQFTNADQRELATATWTRTVSKADGTAYPKDTSDPTPACTTAYKKLSNGESALTIEAFNAAHSNSTYTHFVVYTLRNINLDTYAGSDYYVSAYLSIGGLGDPLVSKAIAIRFDRNEKLSYSVSTGKYFMEGSEVREANEYGNGNKAAFTNLNFNANDSFYVWGFDNTKLKVFGSNALGGEVSNYNFCNSNGDVGVQYKGKYNVYLTNNGELYSNASNVSRPLYIKVDYVKNFWYDAGAVTRVYAFTDGVRADWFDTTKIENEDYFVTNNPIDPTLYEKIIIARMNPENVSSGWWTQTIDIPYNVSDDDINDLKVPNCVAVWTSTQNSKHEYGWEHYQPTA